MALKTQIANFHFDNCLMNGSGIYCSERESLAKIDQSAAGTFITKTATLDKRLGNPKPRYFKFQIGSINSFGLPNLGIDYYLDALADFQAKNPAKTYFLSVAEMSAEKIYQVLKIVQASDFPGLVELNLSCPNIAGKGQLAYDFDNTDRLLAEIFTWFDKPLGIKLPPYFDPSHFDRMAEIINKYPLAFVNAINSIGNGLVIQGQKTAIKPQHGLGGLGGSIAKPTALANVHAWFTRLRPDIAIIGTGGVSSGQDAFEHILCGASMVQVATALGHQGPDIFAHITQELETIMADYGYHDISDFRGKLQYH